METCPKCNVDKTDDSFYTRGARGGLAVYCKDCSNRRRKEWSRTLRGRLSTRANNAHQLTPDTDVTQEFLIALYDRQKGLCHYTKAPLGLKVKENGERHFNTISLDRIDPTRGYYQDNVVICCWIVNAMKGALSVEAFVSLCREVVDHHNSKAVTQ